jgi:hypothetical protein
MNWDCFAPKKVKVFFWILRHGRTHTRASLHRHGVLDTPDCPFCPGTPEDEDHTFATCPPLGAVVGTSIARTGTAHHCATGRRGSWGVVPCSPQNACPHRKRCRSLGHSEGSRHHGLQRRPPGRRNHRSTTTSSPPPLVL